MAMSKSTKIITLLVVDAAFFLLELITGYTVHSLALVADSFHMLNDVLSLLVGLWAVRVARQGSSKSYTYGWQRAETLGALINGVFLIALCLSIFLEAIQRIVEPQEVSQPLLVLVVGCFGLLSNILGLLLFGHAHPHGPDGDAEAQKHGEEQEILNEDESVATVMPQQILGTWNDEWESPTHPADIRQEVIHASRNMTPSTEHRHTIPGATVDRGAQQVGSSNNRQLPSERSPLLGRNNKNTYASRTADLHQSHNHANPGLSSNKKRHGHGHHHDLNMRGVFLHVLGDALGNIGVIASALFIWQTHYSWRFYTDPAISLIITVIILCSAIPLCKAASRMLLQAVPHGLSIDHIVQDVHSLPGISSCHDLHVWQLSDTELVASVHVKVGNEIKDEGSDSYMELARQIRNCMRAYGIRSLTIQPEFHPDSSNGSGAGSDAGGGGGGDEAGEEAAESARDQARCLLTNDVR